MTTNNTKGEKVKTVSYMKQAAKGVKSPKHFQLLFGRFQNSIKHLSIDLQDSACREFRRVAKANYKGV